MESGLTDVDNGVREKRHTGHVIFAPPLLPMTIFVDGWCGSLLVVVVVVVVVCGEECVRVGVGVRSVDADAEVTNGEADVNEGRKLVTVVVVGEVS